MISRNSSIMKEKITLQKRSMKTNEYGEEVEEWEDVTNLRASFNQLQGQEFFRGGDLPQHIASVDARIRIRYRKGIKADDNRILYGKTIYNITAIIHDRKRHQTQLMVSASAVHQEDGSKVNV